MKLLVDLKQKKLNHLKIKFYKVNLNSFLLTKFLNLVLNPMVLKEIKLLSKSLSRKVKQMIRI